jgi:hypothetical protein
MHADLKCYPIATYNSGKNGKRNLRRTKGSSRAIENPKKFNFSEKIPRNSPMTEAQRASIRLTTGETGGCQKSNQPNPNGVECVSALTVIDIEARWAFIPVCG